MILLGNKVTADVISSDDIIHVGPNPIGCMSLLKVWTDTDTQKVCHMEVKVEVGVMPLQAEENCSC